MEILQKMYYPLAIGSEYNMVILDFIVNMHVRGRRYDLRPKIVSSTAMTDNMVEQDI